MGKLILILTSFPLCLAGLSCGIDSTTLLASAFKPSKSPFKLKSSTLPALDITKDHEWVKVDGDIATVGITDFAQSELGDIVFVEIETEGDELDVEEVFGSVEAVKTVSDLFMPLSGEVMEMNPKIEESPEVVNSDPYGEGWMIKIKMSDTSQLDSLMDVDTYKEAVGA